MYNLVMLEVKIVEVSVTRMGFAIVLKPLTESKVVPIFIGPLETYSISTALEGHQPERPLTHDLLKAVLVNLGFVLDKVFINDFKGGTFFAKIFIREKSGNSRSSLIEIDARPSDAIALALRFNAIIYMSEKVYNQVSIEMDVLKERKKEEESEPYIDNLVDSMDAFEMSDEQKDELVQSIIDEFNEPGQASMLQKSTSSNLSGKETFQTKEQVLEQMLKAALKREAYEEAASLRDELNQLRVPLKGYTGNTKKREGDENNSVQN